MASIFRTRRFGRRLLVGLPLIAVPVLARGQGADIVFRRSTLVILTGGREVKFDIELATTDGERERGLMYRKEMGPYSGMLFDFHREMPVSFWMKNTFIPLDMVFIAANGTVRHVHSNAVPFSTDTIPSVHPVRGVLEINGGSARLLGIKPGDTVKHEIFGNL
jgi:uncharacterized membrane protein (UPF0127 family)